MDETVDQMIGRIIDEAEEEKHEGFPNVLELSGADRDRLEDQLKSANGKLRVVVHPFFLKVAEDEGTTLSTIRNGWMKLMASQSDKSLPVLFFAQGGYEYEYLQELWKGNASDQQREKIYFVPTYNADPRPLTNYHGQSAWADSFDPHQTRNRDWKRLMDILDDAGVKQCLVGGEFLTVASEAGTIYADQTELRHQMAKTADTQEKEKFWNECVGEAAGRLAQRFEVEFSNLAFPHRRVHAMGLKKPEEVTEAMWVAGADTKPKQAE